MKRKVISCVLAGASVFSLVCINGGNLVAKADGDVTEIRFTEWDGGDTLAVYEEIAEKFNESHPDIHVTVMNVPAKTRLWRTVFTRRNSTGKKAGRDTILPS